MVVDFGDGVGDVVNMLQPVLTRHQSAVVYAYHGVDLLPDIPTVFN